MPGMYNSTRGQENIAYNFPPWNKGISHVLLPPPPKSPSPLVLAAPKIGDIGGGYGQAVSLDGGVPPACVQQTLTLSLCPTTSDLHPPTGHWTWG